MFLTCRWRNENHRPVDDGAEGEVIPPRVIAKSPPRPNCAQDQKDEDSLPPYAVLDAILDGLVEKELARSPIWWRRAFDRAVVKKVEHLLYLSGIQALPVRPRARG